ncbi:polyphenol oxidase family protein [bacterium]|nr:polyphenol oxidase family protein [bacterium]
MEVLFKSKGVLVFFGDKQFDLQALKNKYNYEFKTLHQVHGDKVIGSCESVEEPQADAHFTNQINTALVIKTADCLPIMAFDGEQVYAIHAGWRGLENKIISKTLAAVDADARVFIGGHIHKDNFEVGPDLLNTFDKKYFKDKPNGKYNLNLTQIAIDQILDLGINRENIQLSKVDTYSNPDFNSYRFDKTQRRNLSFIVKT